MLNAEQEAAANAIDGVYAVISTAGTGKTTVIMERFLRMLQRGIPLKDILNLTFTNSAAAEMLSRSKMVMPDPVFRTFHSFAIDLLKKERAHLPFQLCDTVIPVAGEEYKLLFDLVKMYPALNNYRTLKEKISAWKREGVCPTLALEEAQHSKGLDYFYAHAFADYERKCREQGWLDFDDVMVETVALLESNVEVRNRWKKKYIAVDEFQDTDEIQLALLELLFDGNLYCVGDQNQNLYQWRGTHPNSFEHLRQKFPAMQTLYMGINYRSCKKLVTFFKEVLPVDNGIASRMTTPNDEGIEPVFIRYRDDQEEAVQVLKQVTDPLNTAVLARTNRQLFLFERICASRGIKYKILGKKDFFEQGEVKRLLTLAKESIGDPRPASVVLADLIQRHNLLNIYRGTGNLMDGDPAENLNSLVRLSGKKGTLAEFLPRLRKMTHARKSAKGLTLSTIHQSKGREYKHVFLVGAEQGKLPHQKGELSEEARIFFVACTRSAETLQISFSNSHSMFLNNYVGKIRDYDPGVGEVTEDIMTVPQGA